MSKTPLVDLADTHFNQELYPVILWRGLAIQLEKENADLKEVIEAKSNAINSILSELHALDDRMKVRVEQIRMWIVVSICVVSIGAITTGLAIYLMQ